MTTQTTDHSSAQRNWTRAASLRLLVVDDERLGQLVTRRMLERLGHSVVCASDGCEVLALLRQHTFDAVFMDVDMPVLDGMSATRLIRAEKTLGETSQVPVIALTGRTLETDREQCFAAGMNDHVGKPAMLQDLHRALERAVRPTLAA